MTDGRSCSLAALLAWLSGCREEYHRECVRLVTRLHQWDVLRANKAPFAFGLETRVPFLDKDFLQVRGVGGVGVGGAGGAAGEGEGLGGREGRKGTDAVSPAEAVSPALLVAWAGQSLR